jgi:membrane protein required for colicin V production
MVLDLVFVSILLILVAIGAWRGAVASAAGLLALVAGYGGAIWAATHLADPVGRLLVVPGFLAPAVAGTLGFAVVWLVVSALGDLAVAWDRERIAGAGRGVADRVLGGAVGLVRGGLVVVLLAVLASWLDAARDLGALSGLASMPDAGASSTVAASGNLVESVVGAALSDSGAAGQVAARITAHPGEALQNVQGLIEDERLTQLFEDRLFWTLITNGSVDYAMNRAAMRSIVEDPGMRARFAELGLVGEPARESPDVFRLSMATVLEEVAPKVHRLQHDPELNALAQDPEIVALVEAGDMMALVGHPSVRRLVERVSGQ